MPEQLNCYMLIAAQASSRLRLTSTRFIFMHTKYVDCRFLLCAVSYSVQPFVQEFSVFKHLFTIYLQLSPRLCEKGQEKQLEATISKCIKIARGILEQNTSPGKKLIKLIHTHEERGEHRNIRATKVDVTEVE